MFVDLSVNRLIEMKAYPFALFVPCEYAVGFMGVCEVLCQVVPSLFAGYFVPTCLMMGHEAYFKPFPVELVPTTSFTRVVYS